MFERTHEVSQIRFRRVVETPQSASSGLQTRLTNLIGYSVRQYQVIQYQVDLPGSPAQKWVDYLFAEKPIRPSITESIIADAGRYPPPSGFWPSTTLISPLRYRGGTPHVQSHFLDVSEVVDIIRAWRFRAVIRSGCAVLVPMMVKVNKDPELLLTTSRFRNRSCGISMILALSFREVQSPSVHRR